MITARYLITPPALWDDPPVDDFSGLPLPDSDDGDAEWLPGVPIVNGRMGASSLVSLEGRPGAKTLEESPMPKQCKPISAVLIPIGPSIAYVPLSRGLHALIDRGDAVWAQQWKWYAAKFNNTKDFRAVRKQPLGAGKYKTILMHSALLGLSGSKITADHVIPGTGLDNRRCNLRPANRSQQQHNQRLAIHNTSGFKGVSFYKRDGNWQARIKANGKKIHIGYFPTPEQAHAAYVAEATRLYGEFARGG